ncbi:dTDP-4-dehydrorhamnose 3,5-epimerase [Palleronia sp.]|uniref:dTDP-4-dehydrorhamnose 3,5-epimerase n=1 Tax=Palleronia sp. TaxID=1940284 RepID=UPI0035C834CB
MQIEETSLPGVLVLTPRRIGDHRGFFSETWSRPRFAAAGIDVDFVQDNHSVSEAAGTVRGLHFQAPPRAQAKLVRCGRGRLFDVAVDIRRGSPTFGQWFGTELSFANGRQMFLPAGFAHGFATLEPETEVIYKCSDTYAPEAEAAIRWDDPGIGIDWPSDAAPTLSDRDRVAPLLADLDSPFVWSTP